MKTTRRDLRKIIDRVLSEHSLVFEALGKPVVENDAEYQASLRNLDRSITSFMNYLKKIDTSVDVPKLVFQKLDDITSGPIAKLIQQAMAGGSMISEKTRYFLPMLIEEDQKDPGLVKRSAIMAKIIKNSNVFVKYGSEVHNNILNVMNKKFPDQTGGQDIEWENMAVDVFASALEKNKLTAPYSDDIMTVVGKFL